VAENRADSKTEARADTLRTIGRVDWRFLLGNGRLGRVVYVGEPSAVHLAGLYAVSEEVTAADAETEREPGDAVVVARPTAGELVHAMALLRPGGWIYVETGYRRRRAETARFYECLRILQDGGFVSLQAFWHFPNFESCLEIIPLADPAVVRLAIDRRQRTLAATAKGLIARLLLACRLLPRALPSVSLVGRRPGPGEAPDVPALDWLEKRGGENIFGAHGLHEPSFVLVTPKHETSNNVVFLLNERGTSEARFVVKVPRLEDSRFGLAHEAAVLRSLAATDSEGGALVPQVVAYDDREPPPVLIESAVVGRHIDSHVIRRRKNRYVDAVVAWLETLPTKGLADRASFDRLVEHPIHAFATALQAVPEEVTLAHRTLDLVGPLRDARLPLVLEHGDLAHPNLIWLREGRLGVLDWELAEESGLPLQDLVFFLMYAASSAKTATEHPARWLRVFDDAFFRQGAWAKPLIRREAERLGIDQSLLTPLFVACWARYTARVIARVEGDPVPHARAGATVRTAPAAPSVAGLIRTDRFHALWVFATERADRIDWSH